MLNLTSTRCASSQQYNSEITVDTVPLSTLLSSDNFDAQGHLSLGPTQVLIKVRAVALSNLDTEVSAGQWQFHHAANANANASATATPTTTLSTTTATLPFVTGYEFSGVVVSVGSAVARMNTLLLAESKNHESTTHTHHRQATVRKGQAVVGLAPIDQRLGCLSEYTVQNVSCLIPKPALVLHEDAASIVGPGLRAMTALHYHTTPRVDDTILVVQGASPTGRLTIQLAVHLGLRVLAMGDTAEQLNYLEDLGARVSGQLGSLVRVLDSRQGPEVILLQVMEETGYMGVDSIFESDTSNSTSSQNSESSATEGDDKNRNIDLKRVMLECLGTNGTYVTTRRDLQLDPGESKRLALKGASLSFVFEQTWVLSPSKQGRYLHIMNQIMNYLSDGTLGTLVGGDCTSLGRAREAYREIQKGETLGRTVVKID